ncbi:MAG: hypothetical protein IT204_13645 [Fimbriimonadaceae bacterium]|nr:hypothetical protein [Fimbriimonadaceae bacterium]
MWSLLAPLLLGAAPAELTVDDFDFRGPLGSAGTAIQRLGPDHFAVQLGAAPQHPEWCNKLQFTIRQHALGHRLHLEVRFPSGRGMALNEYHASYSYDERSWQPVHWQRGYRDSPLQDTLEFPEFTADRVVVGHQVPFSFEESERRTAAWRQHPAVRVVDLGQSLGGRPLRRLEVAEAGEVPPAERWVHAFYNQHPGEHNAQWRMVGMLDWLLSPAGTDLRRRSICHFVFFTSPDAPSQGWYRVNAQGVDMNRSYRAAGSSAEQALEAMLVQRDLEALMASPAPVTTLWSMHTWGGVVEPLLTRGPEFERAVGPWTAWRDLLVGLDPRKLVKPLALDKPGNLGAVTWTAGPHEQFGITTILCEGAGQIDTQEANEASGVAILQSLAAFYRGTRPRAR